MPSLREIRRRIASTKDIQKITKAMQTVAGVRLRRAQSRLFAARPYAKKMDEMMKHLASQTADENHPLMKSREVHKSALIVITADRGFCGGFNSNVVRGALGRVVEEGKPDLGLICIGRKGSDTLNRERVEIISKYTNIFQALEYGQASEIADHVIDLFTNGGIDQVDLLYNEFKSVIQQRIVVERLLPIPTFEPEARDSIVDYIYEQSPVDILASLIPKHIEVQIFRALLESSAAEHGARMTAMDAATNNAIEMIDSLTLTMNRARQAGITNEIIEVVSGAAALK